MSFFFSTNLGKRWDTIKTNVPPNEEWIFLGENDFFMHSLGQVFHTIDGGMEWESLYQADMDEDITDLEFWGTNMVLAKEKSIVYSKEPYTDFTETDMSSLVKREINYIEISKDGHLFIVADDSSMYSADLKEAGLGIAENNLPDGISIFPVPAQNRLNILSNGPGIKHINIYDFAMKQVLEYSYPDITNTTIDIAGLANGFYYIVLIYSDNTKSIKNFVKF